MCHLERGAFKKDRDTINNSRNTGMDWMLPGQPDVFTSSLIMLLGGVLSER